jgi:hypothetical protein
MRVNEFVKKRSGVGVDVIIGGDGGCCYDRSLVEGY